jgi:putative polyhydroxyalkanoate system protein
LADIQIHRVHNLGLTAARAAAERMADHLGRKFDLKGDWKGNTLHFERPGVSGLLTIDDKQLNLSVTLGFLLKAMKGSIEKAVTHELDGLFDQVKTAPAAGGEKPKAAPVSAKKAPAKKKKAG